MMTGGSDSQIFPSHGATTMSLPNGTSLRPMALAGCTSVIDIQTDGPHVEISAARAMPPNNCYDTSLK